MHVGRTRRGGPCGRVDRPAAGRRPGAGAAVGAPAVPYHRGDGPAVDARGRVTRRCGHPLRVLAVALRPLLGLRRVPRRHRMAPGRDRGRARRASDARRAVGSDRVERRGHRRLGRIAHRGRRDRPGSERDSHRRLPGRPRDRAGSRGRPRLHRVARPSGDPRTPGARRVAHARDRRGERRRRRRLGRLRVDAALHRRRGQRRVECTGRVRVLERGETVERVLEHLVGVVRRVVRQRRRGRHQPGADREHPV